MIIPSNLKQGDCIKIISSARKISKEELVFTKETLHNMGYNVSFGKHLFGEHNQFSGTDKERAEDLQEAINNPEVKAILCARGGYGTVRIIDKIDFSPLINNPKWIIGYSDVTVLHLHLNKLGLASIHATMPINFKENSKEALHTLNMAIQNKPYSISCKGNSLNNKGEIEAELIGGNLSIIYSLMGTDSAINAKGKILFIEDLDEYLYHVDRMVQNLKLAGIFDEISGLIIGGMNNMNDNLIPFGKTAEEIIYEAVANKNYPICFNFPAGHIKDNRALVFGKKTKLTVSNLVNLVF